MNKQTISELSSGTLFIHNDKLYIRTENFYDDYTTVVAVNIHTGGFLLSPYDGPHLITPSVIYDCQKKAFLECLGV